MQGPPPLLLRSVSAVPTQAHQTQRLLSFFACRICHRLWENVAVSSRIGKRRPWTWRASGLAATPARSMPTLTARRAENKYPSRKVRNATRHLLARSSHPKECARTDTAPSYCDREIIVVVVVAVLGGRVFWRHQSRSAPNLRISRHSAFWHGQLETTLVACWGRQPISQHARSVFSQIVLARQLEWFRSCSSLGSGR